MPIDFGVDDRFVNDPRNLVGSATAYANGDRQNTAAGGNAMTAYRAQQQNNNWLFGNPAAAEFNGFIANNMNFQQSYQQGMAGAGRTLQTGLEQLAQWANNSRNLIYGGLAVVVGVAVLKGLGGKKRR